VRQRRLGGGAAQVERVQPVHLQASALGAGEEPLDDLGAAAAGGQCLEVGGGFGGGGGAVQDVAIEGVDELGVVGVLGVVLRRVQQPGQHLALAAAALQDADVALQPDRICRAVQDALVQLTDSAGEMLRRGEEGGGDAVGAAPRVHVGDVPGDLGVAAAAGEDLDVEVADVGRLGAGGDQGGGDGPVLEGFQGQPGAAA